MSKFIQAFLTGLFFTFILDFFLFLGIYENYIKKYNIEVYYNILFADHQNIYIFLTCSLLIGFIIIYIGKKIAVSFMSLLFISVFATLIPSLGYSVAEALLMQKAVTIHTNKFTYYGNLYYSGRKNITFYDYDLKKVIILNKNTIK
jgi:TM2 domain-containing membrane protein YozV